MKIAAFGSKQARRLHVTLFILTLKYVLRLVIFSCAMREEVSDGRKNINREELIPAFADPILDYPNSFTRKDWSLLTRVGV